MDLAKIQQLVTFNLDDAEARGEQVIVTFRYTLNATAVALYVNPDGTFVVARQATASDHTFLNVADAYARAAAFVRAADLRSA